MPQRFMTVRKSCIATQKRRKSKHGPLVMTPTGKTIDGQGWGFPAYELFGYIQITDIAARVLSPWFYTDVFVDKLWVWGGCDYSEATNHFLHPDNYGYPASVQNNTTLRWSTPYFIESCNEEDSGFSYWVERETIGSVETLSVWMFQASAPAYYYPHLDFSGYVPGEDIGLLAPIVATGILLMNLFHISLPALRPLELYAQPIKKAFAGDTNKPFAGDTNKPFGGQVI